MSIIRNMSLVAAWGLVFFLTVPAVAQVRNMQLFAPADRGSFGGGPRVNQGYFLSFEYLAWWVQSPRVVEIGSPNVRLVSLDLDNPTRLTQQTNSLDTGMFSSELVWGERFEIGFVEEHCGWYVGTLNLKDQTQSFEATDVSLVLDDPVVGPLDEQYLQGWNSDQPDQVMVDLPVFFDHVDITNSVDTWGVELMAIYRTHPGRHNMIWEFLGGVRYFQFDETFYMAGGPTIIEDDTTTGTGTGNTTTATTLVGEGILDDSDWRMEAENHIVGPQLGLRLLTKHGRWTMRSQGMFFAGYNSQNFSHRANIGTKLEPPGEFGTPLLMPPLSVRTAAHHGELSPGIDCRFETSYAVTRAITLKAGYSALWMNGIARASNVLEYTTRSGTADRPHVMGIDATNNRQTVLMHGVTMGLDVNY